MLSLWLMKVEKKKCLMDLYQELLAGYGEQGWWPLLEHPGSNPTKTGAVQGYHPGEYEFPKNDAQRFEIMCGAVLTQNTNWQNVEKALLQMQKEKAIDPAYILNVSEDKLQELIKPAGFFRAKSRYLRNLSHFFLGLAGKIPSRKDLLKVKGVGEETADSILLYAYNQQEFVVDAYTRRFLSTNGLMAEALKCSYAKVKKFCVDNLPQDLIVYQEFHALVVEHNKRNKKSRSK